MSAKWLKWTIAAAGATVGAAAIIGKLASDKKKDEKLDQFLLPEENDSTEYESVPALTKDIQSWHDIEAEDFSVKIKFSFENPENAREFQDLVAQEGLSSNYSSETGIVNVIYGEDTTMEGLNFLAATLEDACVDCEAEYQGFNFL